MNNLHLSDEAQTGLGGIKSCIAKNLEDPSVAISTVRNIAKDVRRLWEHSLIGASLSSIADVKSDYRFLMIDSYLTFHRVLDSDVYAGRVLYDRRGYLRVLLGDVQDDETNEQRQSSPQGETICHRNRLQRCRRLFLWQTYQDLGRNTKIKSCSQIVTFWKQLQLGVTTEGKFGYCVLLTEEATHVRDALENLYFRNIIPNDQIVKSGTALKRTMGQSAECGEKLVALLEDKERVLLLRLINVENETGGTMTLENFILGFRLGVRMVLETLNEDDDSLLGPNKEGQPMAERRPSGDNMVRKREDGRWEGRVVVGHKQNGRPIFRYVLAKTQRELLNKFHRDLGAFQDVELTEGSRTTLGRWLDWWTGNYGVATPRPDTLRNCEQFIRCYIEPYLRDKIVSRVTRMDIQKLYRELKHEGRVRKHPEHGHELSNTMVLRIHTILHRCPKDAEAAHIIARNPTDRAIMPKASYKPKQTLAKKQMRTFLTAVERNEVWRDFFYTELATGPRWGEICGLVWQSFDEKAGTLRVLQSMNVPRTGELEIGETRTSQGRRTIRLPPNTVQRLRERKQHAVSQWIFPEPLTSEKPVRLNTAYYWMKRILRETDLPATRSHDLRHTFATHALASGMGAKTLPGILGYTSASFTLDTCTYMTPNMQQEASHIMGGFLEDLLGKDLEPWQKYRPEGDMYHG